MHVLIPSTTYIISWTPQNTQDTTDYYPRAVIRDAVSDTVLADIELVDSGNRRYKALFNVPQDPTGRGRTLTITKTVYTDANHTEISPMYGVWSEDYLVIEIAQKGGGASYGGQQAGVDLNDIRKLITEEIQKAVPEIVAAIPQPEQTDLTQLVHEIDGVKRSFGERLRDWLKLGKKAEDVEEITANLEMVASRLIETIETAQMTISDMTTETLTTLQEQMQESITRLDELPDTIKTQITDTIQSNLEESNEILRRNIEDASTQMSETVSNSLNNTLNQPMKIQSTQDYNMVREQPQPEQSAGDSRISRLLS